MPDCLQNSDPSLYAHDTAISASSHDFDELVAIVNADLDSIRKWIICNKLQIHPRKTKYLFIGSPYNLKHKISDHQISISNTPVARIGKFSCLGVIMDGQLSWRSHVDHVC